jgi:hypothetical protein
MTIELGPSGHTAKFEEGERQAMLLALAKLSLERPGWVDYLGGLAEKLQGRDMFEEFRRIHADPVEPNNSSS